MAKRVPIPSSGVLSQGNPTAGPHPKDIAALAELVEDFTRAVFWHFLPSLLAEAPWDVNNQHPVALHHTCLHLQEFPRVLLSLLLPPSTTSSLWIFGMGEGSPE